MKSSQQLRKVGFITHVLKTRKLRLKLANQCSVGDGIVVSMCTALSRFSQVRLCLSLSIGTVATRLLCPWDSPGMNIKVSCHDLLQGIFPTPESEPTSLTSSALVGRLFIPSATWEAFIKIISLNSNHKYFSKELHFADENCYIKKFYIFPK